MQEKVCPNCNTIHNKRGVCCSKKCGYEYRIKKNTIWRICPVCGKEFPTDIGHINQGRGINCSEECARIAWDKDTPNRSKKISTSLKGRKITWGDKISKTLTGTTLPEEQKQKIRTSTKKTYAEHPEICERTVQIGPKNGNWSGGASYKDYCEKFNPNFKERVRIFFGHVCMLCGESQGTGEKLHVHHVHYKKDSCCSDAPRLFVPLCRSCHSKTTQIRNREYYTNRFTELINTKYNGKCYFTKEEMSSLPRY